MKRILTLCLGAMLCAGTFAQTDALLKLRDERRRHPRIESLTFPGSTKWREAYDAVYGHGAMIENPWAAFRIYFNEAQSVDLYLKTRERLEIDKTCFYTTPEQLAEGWGQDVLRVGKSIGCGSFRGWDGENTVPVDSVASRTQRVVDSATVEVIDRGWIFNGHPIDMTQRYTVAPDSPWLTVEITLDGWQEGDMFCTGVQRLDFDPEQLQGFTMEIEVNPANAAGTVTTALDRLTLLRPTPSGTIRYRVKAAWNPKN